MENNFDTIVAIITPIAHGAVGIIRISGDKAYDIAQSIFSKPIKPKMINYGHIISDNQKIDEVILLPFKSPHSYTGEDVIEIQCHGSYVILDEILNIIISKGARIAQKGEFTKRAFLNHRIDLSQAEAVLDIIESKSQKSAHNALNNLGGYLKQKIDIIKSDITELYSKIIASVDFPEDVNEVDNELVVTICNDNISKIDDIINNSKSHDFIRDGISACLIGKPNVGKSSLFNALLNYNRAIVTDIAGTTRDTIKETLNIDGYLINFIDTAGIRNENISDKVEQIGIQNSISTIEESDIVLFLFEKNLSEIDKNLLEKAKNKKIIFIKTKSDIYPYVSTDNDNITNIISVSSVTNEGINDLKCAILKVIKEFIPNDTNYTTNMRQISCLKAAKNYLQNVVEAVNLGDFCDLYSNDLKSAIMSLGEISGEVLTDTILDDIFSNFCIGK